MDRRLIQYLPPIMRDIQEIAAIAESEQAEFSDAWDAVETALNDQFISTATEYGIKRWEKILSITPKAAETLDERRFRIFARLSEQLPYTFTTLKNQLESLCGKDGVTMDLRAREYILSVRVALAARSNFEDVKTLLARVVPANMIIDLSLPVFADATWAQIAAAVAANNVPENWIVGSTKDITLTTGEVLTLAIYGKKHDDLVSGGKAGLTLGLKNLMAEPRQMNPDYTSVGGVTGSAVYAWLQGDLYNSLPADLKAAIKTVNKKTSAGNRSTTINTDAMNVFLLSMVECYGTAMDSAPGEGSKYPIFTDDTSRIKKLANGTGDAFDWWTRSPDVGYNDIGTDFCNVGSSGRSGRSTAPELYGVCFGFCI